MNLSTEKESNLKEHSEFVIQLLKECKEIDDVLFFTPGVCHQLNRRPLIDELRNQVKENYELQYLLRNIWIKIGMTNPKSFKWQAIFAISLLRKTGIVSDNVIKYLYNKIGEKNDDDIDAKLALIWHLQNKEKYLQFASKYIHLLKNHQERYLNVNEYTARNGYLVEQEIFYFIFQRIIDPKYFRSQNLYQILCDSLCPPLSFISDFHGEIANEVIKNKQISFRNIQNWLDFKDEEVLAFSFDFLINKKNIIPAYIAQIRKSTGLAQMQILVRDTKNVSKLEYNSSSQISDINIALPSFVLRYHDDFSGKYYVWKRTDKLKDGTIQDYQIQEIINKNQQEDNYLSFLESKIEKYFNYTSDRYKIISDGEISFYCLLFKLTELYKHKNFNINNWLNKTDSKRLNNIDKEDIDITFRDFMKRIVGGPSSLKARSFAIWLIYKANRIINDDKLEDKLPGSNGRLSISNFLKNFNSNLDLEKINNKNFSIEEYLKGLIVYLDRTINIKTALKEIIEYSPVIILKLEEEIRKNEDLPRCFAVFEIIPDLFTSDSVVRKSTSFAICTLQGPYLYDLQYNKQQGQTVENIINRIEENIRARIDIIKSAFEPLTQQIIRYEIEQPLKIAIESAKRSAIASVMSRNMSHNMGSHSLVKLGNYKFLDNIFTNNYDELIKQFNYKKIKAYCDELEEKKKKNATKNWLKIYNDNIRIRMDLIADIGTNVPTSEYPRSIKEDVLSKYTDNIILCNTVSGVDSYQYNIDYVNKEDIKVAIPNDILGMDAFSIILENIIRNSAKHGSIKNKNGIAKIKVETTDGSEIGLSDYFRIFIYEECGIEKCMDEKCNKKDIILNLNQNIDRDIIDSENKLRQGAWGVLEMKIAAAYLRKIPIELIDADHYKLKYSLLQQKEIPFKHLHSFENKRRKKLLDDIKDNWHTFKISEASSEKENIYPSILKCHCCKNPQGFGKGFGYTFYLRKPKEVLVCDFDDYTKSIKDYIPILNNEGITVLAKEKIEYYISQNVFNHKFLIVLGNYEAELLQQNESGLPFRIINLDHASFIRLFFDKGELRSPEEIIKKTWDEWMNRKRMKYYFNGIAVFTPTKVESGFYFKPGYHLINQTDKTKLKEIKENQDKLSYLDIGTSFSYSKMPFKNVVNPNTFEEYWYNKYPGDLNPDDYCFLESMSTKICIIDERIQSFLQTKVGDEEFTYNDIFQCMNIFTPSVDVGNLNSNDFKRDRVEEKVLSWIEKEQDRINFDFIVIHLGIIEKFIGDAPKEAINIEYYIKRKIIKHNIKTELESNSTLNDNSKLIISSGRGKPHNLPSKVRFLNYSQLAYYITSGQSKFILSELCNSVRKLDNSNYI